MKSFAEIDKDNKVLRVIIVESAEKAREITGGGTWVEAFSDNPNKNFPGKGNIYNHELENFYTPQPHEDWILNDKLKWKPKPNDENIMIIPSNIKPKVILTEDNLIYKWDNNLCKWINI